MLYELYKKILNNEATYEDFNHFLLFLSTHTSPDFVLHVYREKIKEEKKMEKKNRLLNKLNLKKKS